MYPRRGMEPCLGGGVDCTTNITQFPGKGFASFLSLSLTLTPTTLLPVSTSLTVENEAGGNGDAVQLNLHLTGSVHNELEITGRKLRHT